MSLETGLKRLNTNAYIPVVSELLHFPSMTVLVFLRRGFGFGYFQSLSTWIVVTFAVSLFTALAWASRRDNTLWLHCKWLCLFLLTSLVILYFHWIFAFAREMLQKRSHDYFSGNSWIGSNKTNSQSPVAISHLLLDPLIAFGSGFVCYAKGGEFMTLGAWLILTSVTISLKEARNYWYPVRSIHRDGDAREEAKKNLRGGEKQSKLLLRKSSSKGTSKRKYKAPKLRKRRSSSELRVHYANILEIEPPYSAQAATEAYFKKMMFTQTNNYHGKPTVEEFQEAHEFFKANYPS